MKVLHVGNVAGVSSSLKKIDIEQGNTSKILITYTNPFNYESDKTIFLSLRSPISLLNIPAYLIELLTASRIHIHGYAPLKGVEVPLLRLAGKKVIRHYHGSELRGKKVSFLDSFSNKFFVSTPDLLQYATKAIWLPNLVNEKEIPAKKQKTDNTLTILHIPSNPEIKGSSYIDSAISKLSEEGYKINYIKKTGISHKETLELMAESDIYIDQLNIGFYGVSALECSLIGVPVICFINPDFRVLTPYINSTKDTILETIKKVYNMKKSELSQIGEYEKEFYKNLAGVSYVAYKKI